MHCCFSLSHFILSTITYPCPHHPSPSEKESFDINVTEAFLKTTYSTE